MQTTIVAETDGNQQLEGEVNFTPCSQQDDVVLKAVQVITVQHRYHHFPL